jgi:hypothetical protein
MFVIAILIQAGKNRRGFITSACIDKMGLLKSRKKEDKAIRRKAKVK